MNKDSTVTWLIACFLITAVGVALGTAFGTSQLGEKFEREAIKKGHAVWITDENGHPVFKWKEACK